MRIAEVADILDANVLCCEDKLDKEVRSAFGADLMSDALAFIDEDTLLLTGLVNQHVIRTAEMLEVRCIVFVRGKPVPKDILDLAVQQGVVLLGTDKTLYICCGMLYAAGLPGCIRR